MRDRLARELAARLRGFPRDESGALSVWALFLFMACACISAAAVDVTHMYTVRAQMQVAADVAAHSALYRRNQGDTPTQARSEAIRAATWGMPVAEAGQAITASRIQFGTYDRTTGVFVVDETSRSAVQVTAARRRTDGNQVPTFLFRMIGVGSMDIAVSATYRAEADGCMNEGLIAEGTVDVRSNNNFRNGFCLHGNDHVEVNNNNLFEQPGVVVSMPDLAHFVMPSSGFQQNTGLQQALRSGEYDLTLLDVMRTAGATSLQTALETALLTPGNAFRPSTTVRTSNAAVVTLPVNADVTPGSLTAGRVHRATCTGNQSLTFKPANNGPTVYSDFVLITNCAISFSGRVDLENATIYTTNTGAQSIRSNSGGGSAFNIGRADSCGSGNGARIFTHGGVHSSAKMSLNGGQIVALGDVQFSAQGGGGFGASIVSGSNISGTSNLEFSGCGGNGRGVDWDLTVRGMRMAR